MKSSAQISFKRLGAAKGWRSRVGGLRFVRRGKLSFIKQYTRCRRLWLIPRRPRQPHHLAGPADRQPVIRHEHLGRLPLRERRYSFRESTSLMAAFSSASSAYMRLSFAFSASSSFIRLSSETVTPEYFDRQLK